MKFLRKKLDDLRHPFRKGGKWEKFAPAINAQKAIEKFPFARNARGVLDQIN